MRSSSSSRKVRVIGSAASNRRAHRRIRVDRAIRVPVQVFPVLPFVGTPTDAVLVNLSPGGMALLLESDHAALSRGTRLRVHFRLPGLPLTECQGIVSNLLQGRNSTWVRIGVRFLKAPVQLSQRIERMIADDDACDARMFRHAEPRCDTACAFHSLCHKPIRTGSHGPLAQFEISLQRASHG